MSEELARKFHEIYERLAPNFGYETRPETRAFDPTTPNGRLMIAVTDEIEDALRAKLARRDEELKTTDGLLKEATETIGAVVACCTYNSNDDAKIGIYGIDQKSFTMIDQFITHYNDAVSAGKVSVDVKPVKRDLSDAEIEELGAQEAERKEFCPNCEAETPCTHEAELYVCDICGEDFAKYIVSRNCSVSDVSMTQDVLTSIKTPSSIENTNPDYYNRAKTSPDNNKCMWVMVEDPDIDLWCTSCGEEFHLEADTPSDNHMKYCCYCGKEITEG